MDARAVAWRLQILALIAEGRELTGDDINGRTFIEALDGEWEGHEECLSRRGAYVAGFLKGLAFGAHDTQVSELVRWAQDKRTD